MGSEIVQTEFVESRYGKNYVKLLQVKKDGNVHYIKEMEVCTAITLNNHKDYLYGDNSDIVATDTQKNTIYILAKQYGVRFVTFIHCKRVLQRKLNPIALRMAKTP